MLIAPLGGAGGTACNVVLCNVVLCNVVLCNDGRAYTLTVQPYHGMMMMILMFRTMSR